jgi:filamentous hemagglutinin
MAVAETASSPAGRGAYGGGIDAAPQAIAVVWPMRVGAFAALIALVGTERGVGVNDAGIIAAQTGDLTLSSQGKLTVSGNLKGVLSRKPRFAGNLFNSVV